MDGQIFLPLPISPYGITDWRTCQIAPIVVWDPFQQIFNNFMKCFDCGTPLKPRSWKDGHNSHENPRVLYCIEGPLLLVSRVYACTADHRIIAHDPGIVSLCSDDKVPFVLLHKIGLTKKLMFYIVSHVTAGLNFQQIAELLGQLWEMVLRINMLPVADGRKSIWTDHATRKTISSCYTYHYLLNEQKYNSMMAELNGEWLSLDHTFKTAANIGLWSGGKWRTLYDSIFLIMNEKKEVVSWVLTKSTGFIHVRHALLKVHERMKMQEM